MGFFKELFKDNNDINEKSVVGFLSFAMMVIALFVDLITGWMGEELLINEYIDGQVYAMAGTTDTHNIIGLNFTFITPAMTETETVYWLAFEPLRSREPKQKRMLV